MKKHIGIIGLGRIGLNAAKAYLDEDYTVMGYDVDPNVMTSFKEIGGTLATNPKELAAKVETILVLVLNDQQVFDVILGEDGIISGAGKKTIVVCMSTINRSNLEKVARECTKRKIGFIDCPFTGGPARIPTGSLTLIAAATEELLSRVKPALQAIGNITYAGNQPGLGQAIKHCNQLLVGSTHAATMEVIILARKMGLDPSLVCHVVGSGIAGSDYFRLLSQSVLEKKPSPGGLGQMCKDVSIVINTASKAGLHPFVANAAARYFSVAESLGMQQREGADLIEVVEKETQKNNR